MIEPNFGIVEVKHNNVQDGFLAQFYEPGDENDPVLKGFRVKK